MAFTDGDRNAIYATNQSGNGYPSIYAQNTNGSTSAGRFAIGALYSGSNSSPSVAINGESRASDGTGVRGVANAFQGVGVMGYSNDYSGTGVQGFVDTNATNGAAIVGICNNSPPNVSGYAGLFIGRGSFSGMLTKSGGGFLIDHPLDPENKTLAHSFVESPDMKNIYDGVAIADSKGEVTLHLPEYFEALNRDFRYQLTAMGGPAPLLHVKGQLAAGDVTIAGAAPGQQICWQITGIRKDAWAEANHLGVEEDKPQSERGTYLNPEALGKSPEKGVHWKRVAQAARKLPDPIAGPERPESVETSDP